MLVAGGSSVNPLVEGTSPAPAYYRHSKSGHMPRPQGLCCSACRRTRVHVDPTSTVTALRPSLLQPCLSCPVSSPASVSFSRLETWYKGGKFGGGVCA